MKSLTLEQMLKEVGRVGLYAPGSYTPKCGSCSRHFIGDKRAQNCLPCAIKNLACWAEYGRKVHDAGMAQEPMPTLKSHPDTCECYTCWQAMETNCK